MLHARYIVVSILLALLGLGCRDDNPVAADDHQHHEFPPTGAVCPPTQTVSYTNFGKNFLESYCLRCHSVQLTGGDRNGAPEHHNFDTLDLIKDQIEEIDGVAGFGPDSENDRMPPNGATPSDEERRKLAEWLACGAPETVP